MDFNELKSLVARGESETIEFKRKVAFPEKVVREMVAFANTSGGHLLVGVEDDGTIPGLKDPEEHDFALSKALRELCVPRIRYTLEVVPISHKKSILCYKVRSAQKKPHYAKENATDRYGKAYVRVEDKTVKASRELIQILKRTNSKNSFSFSYGDKEGILMKLLEKSEEVTLQRFAQEAKISKKIASSTLVLLVLAGVLEIIPHEKQDSYKLKNF